METYSSISFDLLEIGISSENKSARFEPLRIQLRNVLWSKFRETHDWQFLLNWIDARIGPIWKVGGMDKFACKIFTSSFFSRESLRRNLQVFE